MKHLTTLLLILLPLMAYSQSIVLLRSLEMITNSQALVDYNNIFGNWENRDLDDTFPYVVIRMDLEGDAIAVSQAKQYISLDMGMHYQVTATDKNQPNKILFLVPKGARNIYILCGDGCEKQLLNSGTLIENKVYTCTVQYSAIQQPTPSNDEIAEIRELLLSINNNQQQGNLSTKNSSSTSGKITQYPGIMITNGVLNKVPKDFIGDFVIGYDVTNIGDTAFSDCLGLTSITIPNSVTTIGDSAFCNCLGLTSVTIPNSVKKIGKYAFSNCKSLTSVTISNSVRTIGKSAFSDCKSLTSVTIPNSVDTIGDCAFEGCENLSSVTTPYYCSNIGNAVFSRCRNLSQPIIINTDFVFLPMSYKGAYTIPSGIKRICGGAFYICIGLTSVTIPDGVTTIGDYAFFTCMNLTNLKIPNSVTTIGKSAFADCKSLTKVTLPKSLTTFGTGAFAGCKGLTSVTILDGVTTIGDYAFYMCMNLTNLKIPNSVTTIGESAFADCNSLTKVTIPKNVKAIGVFAFANCKSLTSVTFQGAFTIIDNVFHDCPNLQTLYVPRGSAKNYESRLWNELRSKVIEQ